jgi:hypothetical protein
MIKLITFKTQQTIIGDLTYKDKLCVTVAEPVQVISVPPRSATDPGGIGFVPYLEYSEEFKTGISFHEEDILTINTPVVELLNQYNKMFGSGIQIASSGLKLV